MPVYYKKNGKWIDTSKVLVADPRTWVTSDFMMIGSDENIILPECRQYFMVGDTFDVKIDAWLFGQSGYRISAMEFNPPINGLELTHDLNSLYIYIKGTIEPGDYGEDGFKIMVTGLNQQGYDRVSRYMFVSNDRNQIMISQNGTKPKIKNRRKWVNSEFSRLWQNKRSIQAPYRQFFFVGDTFENISTEMKSASYKNPKIVPAIPGLEIKDVNGTYMISGKISGGAGTEGVFKVVAENTSGQQVSVRFVTSHRVDGGSATVVEDIQIRE